MHYIGTGFWARLVGQRLGMLVFEPLTLGLLGYYVAMPVSVTTGKYLIFSAACVCFYACILGWRDHMRVREMVDGHDESRFYAEAFRDSINRG